MSKLNFISVNKIFFDSIIFALQNKGGISNYWRALIAGIRESGELFEFISNQDEIINSGNLSRSIKRYCTVSVPDDCNIFHGSYYRTARSKRAKNVITVYDFMYERFESRLKKLIHCHQKYSALKKADLIIAISNSTKNDLVKFYPEFSAKNIVVIPLGVDTNKFYFSSEYRPKTEYENAVLFVGGRKGYKRFDVAVEILSHLKKFKLGIVGEPLTAQEVELLDKKIAQRWVYYGRVSDEKLNRIYQSVFCFIFTSSFEGFGLPLIEAQACGCPVIASNTSSLAEVGGESVKYGDNLNINTYLGEIKSLENKNVRDQLIKLGLKNSKRYNWGNCVKMTLNAYKSIC